MPLTDHDTLKSRLAALGIDTAPNVVPPKAEEPAPCRTDGKYKSLARNLNAEKKVTRDAIITIRVTSELKNLAVKAAKPRKLAPYVEKALISALKAEGYSYGEGD